MRVTAPIACLSLSRDHRHFFVLAGTQEPEALHVLAEPGLVHVA